MIFIYLFLTSSAQAVLARPKSDAEEVEEEEEEQRNEGEEEADRREKRQLKTEKNRVSPTQAQTVRATSPSHGWRCRSQLDVFNKKNKLAGRMTIKVAAVTEMFFFPNRVTLDKAFWTCFLSCRGPTPSTWQLCRGKRLCCRDRGSPKPPTPRLSVHTHTHTRLRPSGLGPIPPVAFRLCCYQTG